MTDEEIQHLRRLRKTIKARLDELEIQAANYGPARVPAEISVEMRGAKEELERIDATLKLPTISNAVQEATGPEAAIKVLRTRVEHIGDQMRDALIWTNTQLMETRNLVIDAQQESRDWRAKQERERWVGTLLTRGAIFALTIAVIVLFWIHWQ